MDQIRFDEIVAVFMANLSKDIAQFAHVQRDSCLADVSDCGGVIGVALMGAKVDSDELQDFSRQFAAKFEIFGVISPCLQKLQNDQDEAATVAATRAAILAKLSPAEIKSLGF